MLARLPSDEAGNEPPDNAANRAGTGTTSVPVPGALRDFATDRVLKGNGIFELCVGGLGKPKKNSKRTPETFE